MKLYVLIMVHEHTHYNFDLEKDVSEYYKVFAGVFDSKEKAEKVAAGYLDMSSPYCYEYFNSFRIKECDLNSNELVQGY